MENAAVFGEYLNQSFHGRCTISHCVANVSVSMIHIPYQNVGKHIASLPFTGRGFHFLSLSVLTAFLGLPVMFASVVLTWWTIKQMKN